MSSRNTASSFDGEEEGKIGEKLAYINESGSEFDGFTPYLGAPFSLWWFPEKLYDRGYVVIEI